VDFTIGDEGDVVPCGSDEETLEALEKRVSLVVRQGSTPVVIGGDHITTLSVVRALQHFYRPLEVVYLDAHPDLYFQFKGDSLSHACVVSRLLELEGVREVYLVGVREWSDEEVERIQKLKIPLYTAKEVKRGIQLKTSHWTHLSIDIDVLDPLYAPGVPDWIYGGLSPRQLLEFIQNLQAPIVSLDLVEVNPRCEREDITSVVAAYILVETLGKIASDRALAGLPSGFSGWAGPSRLAPWPGRRAQGAGPGRAGPGQAGLSGAL